MYNYITYRTLPIPNQGVLLITYGKVAIAGLIASATLLSGCSSSAEPPSPNLEEASQGAQDGINAIKEGGNQTSNRPPSPKEDWVEVPNSGGMKKLCDGQVMIYKDSGFREVAIAGVYPHPECPPD